METAALGRRYNVKIVVVPKCADFRLAALHRKGPKCVVLWFTGTHFDFLKLVDGKELPSDLTGVSDDLGYSFRAGGHDDDQLSTHTVWTDPTLCPAGHSKSVATARTARAPTVQRSGHVDPLPSTSTSVQHSNPSRMTAANGRGSHGPSLEHTVWTNVADEQDLSGF